LKVEGVSRIDTGLLSSDGTVCGCTAQINQFLITACGFDA
jgi:hypothetical protein